MKISRLAVAIFAVGAILGAGDVSSAAIAQAQPGPFPQWCRGDFWDPAWGPNWDEWHCHDWHRGPEFRGPGWDHRDWDHHDWDHRR